MKYVYVKIDNGAWVGLTEEPLIEADAQQLYDDTKAKLETSEVIEITKGTYVIAIKMTHISAIQIGDASSFFF